MEGSLYDISLKSLLIFEFNIEFCTIHVQVYSWLIYHRLNIQLCESKLINFKGNIMMMKVEENQISDKII